MFTNPEVKRLSRRAATISFFGAILTACGEEASPPTPVPSGIPPIQRIDARPVASPTPVLPTSIPTANKMKPEASPTVEKVPEFPPSLFSETIIRSNLIPQVLPTQRLMFASDKMLMGDSYLKRFKQVLSRQPVDQMPTLGGLGIVSSKALPIALPADATIAGVLDKYTNDFTQTNIIYWGQSEENAPYLMATMNQLQFDEKTGWRLQGSFHANFGFPFGDPK